jgi:ribonuclease T2
MIPSVISRIFAAALALALVGPAAAQDRRQNEPGQFDYFVLSLSWSPSFCAASEDRAAARNADRSRPDPQCGARPYAFVVHGLWPQYEKGFPEFCQVPAPRLNRDIVSSMLDLMPSPRLVFHEWDRHGTCSGLAPRAFFDTVRKARAVVKIPPEYLDVKETLDVTPSEVEEAFVKANPGMTPESIAIGCDRTRLHEVRVCLSRDFGFRACPDVDRRACRRERVSMPPLRGG